MKLIHADETTTQVLNEEGKLSTSTSYMWVYRSNKHEVPIVLYDYHSTRSGDCPKEFLKGYIGYLELDVYDGYNKVENVVRCLCNVHALRKFKDSYKLLPNNKEYIKLDRDKSTFKSHRDFSSEKESKRQVICWIENHFKKIDNYIEN